MIFSVWEESAYLGQSTKMKHLSDFEQVWKEIVFSNDQASGASKVTEHWSVMNRHPTEERTDVKVQIER